ncbi:MAG: iron ABC transporter substrate-binding protein [Gammaproteobacteria bacterium]|nr:MAG: iron ABC transporter substrate-binding protein [Gammaproteobacteria bacterium]
MNRDIFRSWMLLLGVPGLMMIGCEQQSSVQTVTVYVSEDQVFSEPVLRDFERDTGIRVKAVYDTEEAKSTGAMNRLIAEKANPQADVYWANEPIRAEVLKQQGIASPYQSPNAQNIPPAFRDAQGYWTGFSARARVLLVNRGVKEQPASILAYADPRWKGRSVIANPLFGTTTSEIAALFTLWGDQKAQAFMEALKKNRVAVSTSNGESADFVAAGRYDFSLVDSDDAVNRMRQGKPVDMVYPDQGEGQMGTFIVPNAVVLIKGAPHPNLAKQLIDYLLSRETERKLAFADCAQIPLHPGVEMPPELKPIQSIKTMPVDYAEIARKMLQVQPYLREWAGL